SKGHFPATREDFVPAVFFVPFRHGCVLMHVLNNVSPTDTRIIGAETDLPFLRSVRNDAHLSAAEIVIKQILEPHAGDEQEVPAIRPALRDIAFASIAADFTVILTG